MNLCFLIIEECILPYCAAIFLFGYHVTVESWRWWIWCLKIEIVAPEKGDNIHFFSMKTVLWLPIRTASVRQLRIASMRQFRWGITACYFTQSESNYLTIIRKYSSLSWNTITIWTGSAVTLTHEGEWVQGKQFCYFIFTSLFNGSQLLQKIFAWLGENAFLYKIDSFSNEFHYHGKQTVRHKESEIFYIIWHFSVHIRVTVMILGIHLHNDMNILTLPAK